MSRLYTIVKAAVVAGAIAVSSIASYYAGHGRGVESGKVQQLEEMEEMMPGVKAWYNLRKDFEQREANSEIGKWAKPVMNDFEEWLKE